MSRTCQLGVFTRQLAPDARDDARLASLSAREREVLLDTATGLRFLASHD
jgi:hypothetical protein